MLARWNSRSVCAGPGWLRSPHSRARVTGTGMRSPSASSTRPVRLFDWSSHSMPLSGWKRLEPMTPDGAFDLPPPPEAAAQPDLSGEGPGSGERLGRPVNLRARLAYLSDLTLHLAFRDLASRHRGSVLGWLWALALPLLQLLVTYFLFTKVIPLNIPDYPVFLLAGILPWSWFVRSLVLGASSLEQSRALVLRPGFPTMVLPVKAAVVGLLDYLLALPVLLIALAATVGLDPETLFLPVLIALELLLIVALLWLLAPLQVFFRDIQHLVLVGTTLLFWMTPVFYDASKVPQRFRALYELNPMAHLIEWQRGILLYGNLPSARAVLTLTACVSALVVVGFSVFASLRDRVPEQL